MARPEGGDGFLRGLEGNPWDEENETDLITVCSRQDFDIFTGWIAQTLLPWLHRIVLHRWKVSSYLSSQYLNAIQALAIKIDWRTGTS